MFVAMLYLLVRILKRRQAKMGVLVLSIVFASSPFVVMNAHLFGYYDALLYLTAIMSTALVLRGHPFFAALLSSLGILTHESYLLIGIPLVCLASIEVVTANKDGNTRWTPHIIAICIPVVVFLATPLLQSLTTDATTLQAQLTERLDFFGFVPTRSKGVALWQTTPFMESFRQQRGSLNERLLNPLVLTSVGPTLLTILFFIHSTFRIRAFSPFSIMLLGLVSAPLAIHAVAWDTARISTYLLGSAFIAWWILAETRTPQRTNSLFLLLALPTLMLNVFGTIPLMDGEVERFSGPLRLLLYFPAVTFVAMAVFQNLGGNWFKEFIQNKTPNKTIHSDEG
jgi:hypothetical protein